MTVTAKHGTKIQNDYYNLMVIKKLKALKAKAVAYKGGQCGKCGYARCLRSLTFHHIDPSQKDFQISGSCLRWKKVKAELDKCELLCLNCHGEVHAALDDEALKKREAGIRKLIPIRVTHRKKRCVCQNCGKPFEGYLHRGKYPVFCKRDCRTEFRLRHVKWPEQEEMQELVNTRLMKHVAEELGITPKTLRKRCHQVGVTLPGRGQKPGSVA